MSDRDDRVASLTDVMEKHFPDEGLIKSTDRPTGTLESAQKAQLNRRGNILFNAGDVESARRIFQTTGYSDGLRRIAEYYLGDRQPVLALKMFRLAHDEARSAQLIGKAAAAIRTMLEEEVKG